MAQKEKELRGRSQFLENAFKRNAKSRWQEPTTADFRPSLSTYSTLASRSRSTYKLNSTRSHGLAIAYPFSDWTAVLQAYYMLFSSTPSVDQEGESNEWSSEDLRPANSRSSHTLSAPGQLMRSWLPFVTPLQVCKCGNSAAVSRAKCFSSPAPSFQLRRSPGACAQQLELPLRGSLAHTLRSDTNAIESSLNTDIVPMETEWFRKCACGQTFYKPSSFSNHINSCRRYKKDLGVTLENARARYAAKPKPKKGTQAIETWYGSSSLDVDHGIAQPDFDATMVIYVIIWVWYAIIEFFLQDPPPPAEPEQLPEGPRGRGHRLQVPTRRYKDFMVTSAIPLVVPMFGEAIKSPRNSPPPPAAPPTATAERRLTVNSRQHWKSTEKNEYGLYKTYWTTEDRPHDPDLYISDLDLKDDEDSPLDVSAQFPMEVVNRYHPFPNWSSYMLGEWYWDDRSGKSRDSFQQLVNIITDPDFKTNDIRRTNWNKVNDTLASSGGADAADRGNQWIDDGSSWISLPVTIKVPFNSTSTNPGSQAYTVQGFRYRPLIPAILAKLRDPGASDHFHIVPSELHWQPSEKGAQVRVYSDLYHSDAFLEAYRDIQLLPPEPDQDELPRCVVALMFSSDETMLTSFGNVKLWPVYMAFGNEPKSRRGSVSLKLFEEMAYFQSVPDAFHDWYLSLSGKKVVGDPVLTHVRRELFHAQWRILLDSEFTHAYEHGLVVDCPDNVRRRFYPRILTYSADYPERVMVVGVRNIGDYPCPRCIVPLGDIPAMGTHSDRAFRHAHRRQDDDARKKKVSTARRAIYETNYAVNARVVENQLKPSSLNAFSDQLSAFGFEMHDMLAVDVLHEVEIGVWKSLFIHLLRLLETIDTSLVGTLNNRFRQLPTYGRDTIRRFSKNVSDRKQFGAREYEDILQCAIPVFEGLFPGDHDRRVQCLLYSMAHWHSFAKLRMHTDGSLAVLDDLTSSLGEDARAFTSQTCSAFDTRELKREYESRKRVEARKGSTKSTKRQNRRKATTAVNDTGSDIVEPVRPSSFVPDADEREGRRERTWNLSTPKFHGLGDVVSYIKRFGTTDSYSTQMSERFHMFPKSRYRRTNKKDVPLQLSRMQTRQARIKKLRHQLYPSQEEEGPFIQLSEHAGIQPYFIGKSQNLPVNLSHFIRLHIDDRATKDFLLKLKQHLYPRVIEALIAEAKTDLERYGRALARLTELANSNSEASEADADNIYFHSETIYRHNVLQVQYTTYDCRLGCDTMNPSTSRRDFMCLTSRDGPSSDTATDGEGNDFVYGRLLGIFHANILYMGPGALDFRRRRFDFLWVRWYGQVPSQQPSLVTQRQELDRVKLIPITNADSWGFIDPSQILRAAHILPRFSLGQVYPDKKDKRILSKCAREREDWAEYYVNRLVDRDMVMRFYPQLAVGHFPAQASPAGPLPRPETPMEVDDWLDRTTGGTVDALLLGCVGGIAEL
ncbi:hypothetical protein NMY22_g3318 [Coprinellus aureogranulatus]|nr:hypothetical protein NMY22_g3318 [Coprinellus aureogranulatus]